MRWRRLSHPMCVIQQLKSPQTMAVTHEASLHECVLENAHLRLEHLLNVGIFGNAKVLQEGLPS